MILKVQEIIRLHDLTRVPNMPDFENRLAGLTNQNQSVVSATHSNTHLPPLNWIPAGRRGTAGASANLTSLFFWHRASGATLFEKSEIDCVGHGLIANIIRMETVFGSEAR